MLEKGYSKRTAAVVLQDYFMHVYLRPFHHLADPG